MRTLRQGLNPAQTFWKNAITRKMSFKCEINEEFIASRLLQHHSDVVDNLPMNLTNLLCAGIEIGLFDMKDMEFYNNERILRRERINNLLMSVKEKHNGFL